MSNFNQTDNNEIMEDTSFPYSPPCMSCQPIIDSTFIRFHSDKIAHPVKIFTDEEFEYKFGVLDINIRSEIPITSKHIHMFFTIDASGSMSDICSDGRTKMTHIHHTLENMLRIFHENKKCNISVHIQSFNTIVKKIIYDVSNICESEIETLVNSVRQIRPGGSTNIELALRNATEEISNYRAINPEHEIVHIFLTDGDITYGSKKYDLLLSLVPQDCVNVFIGYGIDHDSQLLSHLAIEKDNEYRFIDDLEKAGLVYGEIIHGVLYKAIEDVTLTGINIELYDYITNTWSPILKIGNLLSEQAKKFHVRTKNIDDCFVSMFGKTIIKTRQFQPINIYEIQSEIRHIMINEGITVDLGIYILRQRTQELLYESKKKSEKIKHLEIVFNQISQFEDSSKSEEDIQLIKEDNKNIKQELSDFHKIMINYINDNHLEDDRMLKMLCDDIYISYKTIGTSLGNMYTTARQISNGRQQTYMCSATHTQDLIGNLNPELPGFPRRVPLQRQTNAQVINFSDTPSVFGFQDIIDTNDIDNFSPSQDFLSPFSSDTVITLMRGVSGNPLIGHKASDDTSEDEATVKIN